MNVENLQVTRNPALEDMGHKLNRKIYIPQILKLELRVYALVGCRESTRKENILEF
jgi:hypothetical protein